MAIGVCRPTVMDGNSIQLMLSLLFELSETLSGLSLVIVVGVLK